MLNKTITSLFIGFILASSAMYVAAESNYSARSTIERAKIGTHSPRFASPVKMIEVNKKQAPTSKQLECKRDHTKPLEETFICVQK